MIVLANPYERKVSGGGKRKILTLPTVKFIFCRRKEYSELQQKLTASGIKLFNIEYAFLKGPC